MKPLAGPVPQNYRNAIEQFKALSDSLPPRPDSLSAEFWGINIPQVFTTDPVAAGSYGSIWQMAVPSRSQKNPLSHYAIKVAKGEDEQSRRGFHTIALAKEIHILSKLDHPHIVRWMASGIVNDLTSSLRAYMVMPWIDCDLYDVLMKTEPESFLLPERLKVALQVTETIKWLHNTYGVIHGDLNTQNILIQDRDGQLWPKLADFGAALFKSDPQGLFFVGVAANGLIAIERTLFNIAQDDIVKVDVFGGAVILAELVLQVSVNGFPMNYIAHIWEYSDNPLSGAASGAQNIPGSNRWAKNIFQMGHFDVEPIASVSPREKKLIKGIQEKILSRDLNVDSSGRAPDVAQQIHELEEFYQEALEIHAQKQALASGSDETKVSQTEPLSETHNKTSTETSV